jgi:diadenosine tetraphosphatase ApaH/serine/threonine PP2A family protein phosphatase
MRVAVLSDIHANLHALEAVLADVTAEGVDELWCLGDVVGYGARPNECCELVRARADLALCGNHDLAVVGRLSLADFSGDAGVAARWTQQVLAAEHRDWLAGLDPQAERPHAQLFHASPRDPVWEYVLSEEAAVAGLRATTADVVLVGHSHVALAIGWDGSEPLGGLAPAGAAPELAGRRWLLNPGSVGQPRDGDRRAAWLLIDFAARRAAFRRVDYDVAGTQEQIRAAGLPAPLAGRLAHGL